jgi:ABC-type sugar transport system ATPase subunit
VFVSYELPEIMGMSDRILVMYHGGIVREFGREEATEDEVLRAAFGSTGEGSDVASARE